MCNKNHKQQNFTGISKSWHNLFEKWKQILSINLLALQFLIDVAASAAIGLSGVQFVQVIIRFRVQFGINLHEWVFQKAEIARAASTSGRFLKNWQRDISQQDISTHIAPTGRTMRGQKRMCVANFVFRHGWIKLFLSFFYTLKCVGICLLCSRRVQRVMPLHCFIAVKHHWNNLKGNILEIFARKRNKLNWEVLRETAHKLGWKLEGTPKCVTIAEDLFECVIPRWKAAEKNLTLTKKQTNKQTNTQINLFSLELAMDDTNYFLNYINLIITSNWVIKHSCTREHSPRPCVDFCRYDMISPSSRIIRQ